MNTPYAKLSDLLRSMFNAAELRAFLRRLPSGTDLVDALPEGLGSALLAGEAVDTLQRRGRVDRELFVHLVGYAPDRYDEIADVARAWGVVPPPRPQSGVRAGTVPPQEHSSGHDELHREEGRNRGPVVSQELDSVDVAVLVALEEEFEQLRSLVPGMTPVPDPQFGGYYYCFDVGLTGPVYRCVARFIGNMGPDRAGLFADRLIARWHPRVVVMVGIAAGLHDDIHLGDVVVAEQVNAYLSDTKAVPQGEEGWSLLPRPRVFEGNHALLQEVANFRFVHAAAYGAWCNAGATDLEEQVDAAARKKLVSKGLIEVKPSLHRVHLASGPVVVAANGFAEWLRSHDSSIKAVEMEAAGLLEAAATRVEPSRALVIRGISDLGDERKSKLDAIGKGGLRRLAMRNATRMLLALLEAGVLPRGGGQS
ncbi:hypothetical protein [Archangium sp.]|uniref:5'-methylthioadenosine/S-adenosylhomocysteine nucleosidase family protein n=1 Tax=Archangium sp. TaxID=1872627 RepID=UPI00286AB66E|nr:hypothetical protein [Archangium sp.]